MAFQSSGSRKRVKRRQLTAFVCVLLLLTLTGVLWQLQRVRRSADTGPSVDALPSAMQGEELPQAERRVTVTVGDTSVDVNVQPGSGTVLAEDAPPAARQGSVQLTVDVLPVLEGLLADESESDLMRGDALHCIYLIGRARAKKLAEEYEGAGGHLGSIARRVRNDDPVLAERGANLDRVLARIARGAAL